MSNPNSPYSAEAAGRPIFQVGKRDAQCQMVVSENFLPGVALWLLCLTSIRCSPRWNAPRRYCWLCGRHLLQACLQPCTHDW